MDNQFRATWRSQLTKLCNAATDFLESHEDTQVDEKLEANINLYVQRIKNAHINLQKADQAVSVSIKPEDYQKECERVIEYDDKAVCTVAKLEFVLSSKFATRSSNVDANNTTAITSVNTTTAGEFSGVKLKSFELKKFNGKFENWLPFWEQFKSAVHDNRKLSKAAKFNFLSESLEGKAAASIAGFTPTEACYDEAIDLLLEEYGDKDKIIERYIQKLMCLNKVLSNSDVNGLRRLYNDVSSTIRSLTALKVSPSQYDLMVKSILLGAIPAQLRTAYHKTSTTASHSSTIVGDEEGENRDKSLKNLLDFIKIEVEALEKTEMSERRTSKRDVQTNYGTATGLFISDNTNNNICVFCKRNNHATKNCKAQLSIEEKKKILMREARCFRCTRKNHNSKFCKANWIKCESCKGRHITSMCEKATSNVRTNNADEGRSSETRQQKFQGSKRDEISGAAALNTLEAEQNVIYLQTAKGIISDISNNNSVLSRIVMDNGSQRTYVSEQLVSELNLKYCGTAKIKIIPFGEKQEHIKTNIFKRVAIMIKNQYDDKVITINATVVPKICDDILPEPKIKNKRFNKIFNNLADAVNSNVRIIDGINLLIGQDYYWQFYKQGCEVISKNLFAINTFFGWTLQGANNTSDSAHCVFQIREAAEGFKIEKFWELESIGVTSCAANSEKEIIEQTINKIHLDNNRYEVSLPWRDNNAMLNDNKKISMARLRSLTLKLIDNSEKLTEYDAGIRELLESGVAEKIPSSTINNRVYYMPHRPVYREDKATTKMRIVFDASSSEPGTASLNDLLSIGENMVADLLSMLLSFRSNKIVITSDIEKAFLQISLSENDRDVHRFLWFKDTPDKLDELPPIAEYRMARVTFGVASSPFLLTATIQKHLSNCEAQYGSICNKLKRSFYVDDMVISETSVESAITTVKTATEIMAKANFKLRKWNSNDSEVRKHFQSDGIERPLSQKILGINWCTVSDTINVDLKNLIEEKMPRATKRNVLQTMARIYDPLGMLGPFTVRIKILLQKIWKERINWDLNLSGDLLNEFQMWREELSLLKEFSIQRCLSANAGSIEIHIFADASPLAYGAVAYSRQVTGNGEVYTNFICSKNRVRPINKTTRNDELSLPKLELTAALMAARLKEFLRCSLDFAISAFWLWTDSTIALNWINGNGKRIPYVKARVNEINQLSNIYEWRHCDGKSNPADLLTRGLAAKQLSESSVWKVGPIWLTNSIEYWPREYDLKSSTSLFASVESESVIMQKKEPIFNVKEFSKLKRLLRVTAYVLRFTKNCKNKLSKNCENLTTVNNIEELTYREIQQAKYYWIKYFQMLHYEAEYADLEKHKEVSARSKLLSLNPILINGVMRLQGRLSNSVFSDYSSNPIILPKKCHLSEMLINEAHHAAMHGGVNAVLALLRKRFWIIKGRQLIKKILSRCVICKRLHGKGASEPWTTLPVERIKTTRPFETTGIDFAGPLYMEGDGETNTRKSYILLFTCAAIRAVHLELVKDMTVESCINALRRFMSRFGPPKNIISDNAKTFKRADLELRKLEQLLKHSKVQQITAHKGITWKYIPERAAWWGGFWERLVRSVKDCLKAAIDFQTDQSVMAKSWNLRQIIIRRYYRRWQSEYLQQLRTIHHNKSGPIRSINVGDVVLVHEDLKSRLLWKLAVVDFVFHGRDGHVRACNVR